MRILLGLIMGLYASFSSANEWVWLDECHIQTQKTQCSVWFDSQHTASGIKVKNGAQILNSEFQAYSTIDEVSASLLFIQADALNSDSHKQILKKGLLAFVDKLKASQLLGIYGNGANLSVISALGASKSNIKSSINNFELSGASVNPVTNLKNLAGILGGSTAKRKVIYWLTSGSTLSSVETQLLVKSFNEQNIRLVIMLLKKSELDSNSGAAFSDLNNQTKGFFVSERSNKWESVLETLTSYSNNGGVITVDTNNLCGTKILKFSAQIAGQVATQSKSMDYSACVATPPATETTLPIPTIEPNSVPQNQTTIPASSDTEASPPISFSQQSYQFKYAENSVESQSLGKVLLSQGSVVEGSEDQSNGVVFTISEGNSSGYFTINASGEISLTSLGASSLVNDFELPENVHNLVVTARLGEQVTTAKVILLEQDIDEGMSKKFYLLIVGILLLLLLLVLIFRNKSKGTSKRNTFGFLIEFANGVEKRHPLSLDATKIGRSHNCNICLDDDSVSSNHAVIKRDREGVVVLVDLNSTNGTKVNGKEVTQQRINSGDVLIFGELKINFELNR